MSYTPGPWKARELKRKSPMKPAYYVETTDLMVVAGGEILVKANANLIAAAPELYEALEAMQKAVDEFFPEVSEDSTGACLLNRRAILNGAQTRAAKALAKAGGKGTE